MLARKKRERGEGLAQCTALEEEEQEQTSLMPDDFLQAESGHSGLAGFLGQQDQEEAADA